MTDTSPLAPTWLVDAVLSLVTAAYQAGWTDAVATRAPKAAVPRQRRPLTPEHRYGHATTLEVCEYLKISRETLYRMMRRGEAPPAAKVGRAWRYRWEAIQRWEAERGQADGATARQVRS